MKKRSPDPSKPTPVTATSRAAVPGRDVPFTPRDAKRIRFTKKDPNGPAPYQSKEPGYHVERRDYRYNISPRNWLAEQRRARWRLALMFLAGGTIIAALVYLNLAR